MSDVKTGKIYVILWKRLTGHWHKLTAGSRRTKRRWADDVVINPAVGCHYFPPGPRLPSQPLRSTVLWPVLNNTAWRQCVNHLPRVFSWQRTCRESDPRSTSRPRFRRPITKTKTRFFFQAALNRPRGVARNLFWRCIPEARKAEIRGQVRGSLGWKQRRRPDRKCILDALRSEKTRPVAENVV